MSDPIEGTVPEKPFIAFLFKALYGIYDAWDEGNLRKALSRATRLVVFLPTDIKKKLWPERQKIVSAVNQAYRRNSVDWFTSQGLRNTTADRVAQLYLEPFVNRIVDLLDDKDWLEKGALGPRYRPKIKLKA